MTIDPEKYVREIEYVSDTRQNNPGRGPSLAIYWNLLKPGDGYTAFFTLVSRPDFHNNNVFLNVKKSVLSLPTPLWD